MPGKLAQRRGTHTAEVNYRITIRFYEELNDFLPGERRKCDFEVAFSSPRSVKDLIESLGVPHVEVDLILANGESVGFDYLVRDGDRISVYPVFESIDIAPITRLRPAPLRETRFVLDVHLRKLARYLRLFGFDTLYDETFDDEMLAKISFEHKRVLLTRDRGLLKRKIVERGLIVRNTDPKKQIREVLKRLDIISSCKPFSRCLNCNGSVQPIEGEMPQDKIPIGVRAWCREFYQCAGCGKMYWKGSHYEKLERFVTTVLEGGLLRKESTC